MVKLRARCLLLGDAAVGKSCLSHIFYNDGSLFQKNYSLVNVDPKLYVFVFRRSIDCERHYWDLDIKQTSKQYLRSGKDLIIKTTGVELVMKCINIPETNDSVELYILDSAGKETLVEGCEKMWGEPSLLCLVFDLTNEQSFANCTCWMERVQAHCKGLHVPGVLVGNKSDLSARREVQASVAKEWAHSKGLEYHETSAKEMDNCDAPLLSLAQSFYSLYQEQREIMQNLGPG